VASLGTLIAIAAGVAVGLVLTLYRRQPADVMLAGALTVLGAVLALDVLAYATDFRDADGAIDCWPHCTTIQNTVKWSFTIGAVLLPALVAVATVRAVLKRHGTHVVTDSRRPGSLPATTPRTME